MKNLSVKILPLISTKCININLLSKTKKDIIEEMVNLLDRDEVLMDKNKFLDSINERENLCSTGLEEGVAFLHPRSDISEIVKKQVIGIGISKEGIDFAAIDGQPTYIFFILCFKKLEEHLQYLSSISRLCKDTVFLNGLHEAKKSEDIITYIEKKEKNERPFSSSPSTLYSDSIINFFRKKN